jgi:hypothetical protein
MSFLIGNTRIWLPHRRSYISKGSEVPTIQYKYYEKDIEQIDEVDCQAGQGLLFNIPGPGKHIWTVRELSPQDEPDVMQMVKWKRPLARLAGLTGIVPPILALGTAFIQGLALVEMASSNAMSTWRQRIAWFVILLNFVLSCKISLVFHFGPVSNT